MTELPVRRGIAIAQLIGASAWLGAALLFAAVVAPAAFAALPTRTLAGTLVGAVLPALFLAGIVLGAMVAAASVALHRGRIVTAGTVGGLLVAISCAAAQFVVAPRIERARASIGGPIESVPSSDPRRVAFGRLHGASVAWLGVAVVGAAVVAAGTAASLRRT
ncbi:MAG TPA: DUF4149 domain-containing protein [Gemmatimonadaceae bacterium]|nr:DUF4149 domain-containing protein [Gemmatimonadaceae bacterium]